MKILVEILHPAHVHVFRNAIRIWRERGDEVLVVSREKECANELLDAYGIPYTSISRIGRKKGALFLEMGVRLWRMFHLARRFKPDLFIGIMGVTIAPMGKLFRRPAVVFYDTENAGITNRFVYPLAHTVCTPDCYQGEVNGNHVTYPGYHELAYLHPDHFTPDADLVRGLGIDPEGVYFLVRFVSWQASHDIGEVGLNLDRKRELVRMLAEKGRVLISSEGPLPDDLEEFRFRASPHVIHHVMAFASLLVGESATMASESAVLGVPAVFISETGRGYTDEEEARYGLVRNFKASEAEAALKAVQEWISSNPREEGQAKRRILLEEKVDTTAWIVDTLDALHQDGSR